MHKRFRLIMGRNCIAEVLKSSPERLVEVYTSQTPHGDSLYTELVKNRIAVKHVTKKELSQMVRSESHQSYIAAVKERGQPDMKRFLERSHDRANSIVLLLDSIYDPQNLGAILRAGECFGVDLVVYSRNRGADITPVTTKTSAGATELVPIIKVSNLAETMKRFQKEGFWAVCADAGEGSQSLYDMQFPEKTLLILGSEGKGIQPLLLKKCDLHVNIPMLGRIDSLNVSQAASVLLNAYRRQFSS